MRAVGRRLSNRCNPDLGSTAAVVASGDNTAPLELCRRLVRLFRVMRLIRCTLDAPIYHVAPINHAIFGYNRQKVQRAWYCRGWAVKTAPLAFLGCQGPDEVWRVDPGADRVPPGVGEPDPGDEPALRLHGLLDQGGIDVDQAELGPSEHPQRPVASQVTPDQPEVAVIADAPD